MEKMFHDEMWAINIRWSFDDMTLGIQLSYVRNALDSLTGPDERLQPLRCAFQTHRSRSDPVAQSGLSAFWKCTTMQQHFGHTRRTGICKLKIHIFILLKLAKDVFILQRHQYVQVFMCKFSNTRSKEIYISYELY